MLTYTNKTSDPKFNFTVEALTKKELFKKIEERFGCPLEPKQKSSITKQLNARK